MTPRCKERNTVSLPLPASPDDERASFRRLSWLFLTLGLVSIFIGFLAIGAPHVATSKTVLVIGALLVIAGVTEVIHAVMVRNLRGFAMHLLAAVLYLIVGIFVLEDSERAAGVLTLLLAASFLVGGLLRIVFALVEQFPAWPWVLLNGLADLVLGVLIWAGWPGSSDWVIGLFVGIELFFHGWSWVVLGLMTRRVSAAPSV
jgi:uncharacterized membrane protein HdeD (DUF308 family)